MKIAIGSDHAGFKYKSNIIEHLKSRGYEVKDFGTYSEESCNYPEFVFPVAKAVAAGEFDRCIVLGGSGNGEAMAANRVKGVRAGLCWNEESARATRKHNDANVLSLGERMMTPEMALQIVDIFLSEEFEGGRHVTRIKMLDEL